MHQVAVGDVKLDQVDTKRGGPTGSGREGIADLAQPVPVQSHGRDIGIRKRYGRRCHCPPPEWMVRRKLSSALPGNFRGGLAARMIQLEPDRNVGPAPNAFQGAPHCGLSLFVPEPDVGVSNSSLRQDGGRFDGQQRRTRNRQLAEVNQVPVGHASVLGRVLAHRSDHDPIAQLQLPDLDRLE